MIVMRGPDWSWNNQDGGEGNTGTVEAVTDWRHQRNVAVLVRWDTSNNVGELHPACWPALRVGSADARRGSPDPQVPMGRRGLLRRGARGGEAPPDALDARVPQVAARPRRDAARRAH